MSDVITVEVDDVRRVFRVLERFNEVFHQQLMYRDPEVIERFARDVYPEIRSLYYDVVWKWLPEDMRKQIERGTV